MIPITPDWKEQHQQYEQVEEIHARRDNDTQVNLYTIVEPKEEKSKYIYKDPHKTFEINNLRWQEILHSLEANDFDLFYIPKQTGEQTF